MPVSGPLSVVLSAALRERLTREARRRGLPLSTAIRVLVTERVNELDDEAALSAADRWQRQEAWSVWERLRRGDVEEASPADIEGDFAAALRRARGRRR